MNSLSVIVAEMDGAGEGSNLLNCPIRSCVVVVDIFGRILSIEDGVGSVGRG